MQREIEERLAELRAAAQAHDAERVASLAEGLVSAIRSNLASSPKAFVAELTGAVDAFDRPRAQELCAQLVAHLRGRARPYPLAPAKTILGILRRKRHFDLIGDVADTLIQTGQAHPNIRRQYAQALLDQGHLSAGHDVLQVLEQDCRAAKDTAELAEARGLMGRAKKQMYVDAVGKPGAALRVALKEAIDLYAGEFKKTGLLWHGINAVALLDRARRDRVRPASSQPSPTKLAKRILTGIKAKQNPDAWDCASAAEACLALQDHAGALEWVLQYVAAESADAFEIAGTLRQFEQVWQLDTSQDGPAKILQVLRSTLLEKEGGSVELAAPGEEHAVAQHLEADKTLEAVLGPDRYKTFQWYRKGLERAAGVAKIVDRNGNGRGTGFLLRSSDVHPGIEAPYVVLTNAHVVSDDPAELKGTPASLRPDEVRIRFEAGPNPAAEFEVEDLLFTSSRHELDCSILTLNLPVELQTPYPIAKRLPAAGRNRRVYVIGHPRGGGLSFSIDDNLLLDHEQPRVHYRAPTEGGSSGSPVFDQQWDLVALHHAGGPRMRKLNGRPGAYPANEGVAIWSILKAAQRRLA